MRVFHFVIVKRKRALSPNSFFFFNDSHIFLKYFHSNQNLPSFSLFSMCFLWFFYLGVHSLEVTRAIRNNKLHFTWGCSILLLKKGKGPWKRIPFFLFHRGTGVLSWFIFHCSSRTWLALALASRLPPLDRKTLKNCACSADPDLLNETKGS